MKMKTALLSLALLLSACAAPTATPAPTPTLAPRTTTTPSPTPTPPAAATPTPTPRPRPTTAPTTAPTSPPTSTPAPIPPVVTTVSFWDELGLAVPGKYADAEVVEYEQGKWRMYYAEEPEVPDFQQRVFSAVSSDGLAWKPEGLVRTGATFPDVVALPDGRWRMYFQSGLAIKSAISSDGRAFQEEPGSRLERGTGTALDRDSVAAPTTIRRADGTWLMVYRGGVSGPYSATALNQRETYALMTATSLDGLSFTKTGVLLDSRTPTYDGHLDGPELIIMATEDGQPHLFFWASGGKLTAGQVGGTYEMASTDGGKTFAPPQLVLQPPPPGVPDGDPTVFVAGGNLHLAAGRHTVGIIQYQKRSYMQWSQPPAMAIDPAGKHSAILSTTKGDITVELFAKEAPITVNNFIFLAREGFYNDTKFHRIIKGFMMQGGDPTGTGTGSPGYRFADEPVKRDYKRGTLAMANSGPSTNGSQFFIVHQDYPLPKSYTIFGQVTAGLEVVDAIAGVSVGPSARGEMSVPRETVRITGIEVVVGAAP